MSIKTTLFSFALWNMRGCRGNKGDVMWTELSDGDTILKNDVIMLQETHVESNRRLDASAPKNDRYGRIERLGFSGYLTPDCGILFRPKTWKIKKVIDRPTYLILEVTGAAPMLPIEREKPVDTIFLISHHFPCKEKPSKGWDGDKNPLSHVPEDAVVIIGADWNMLSCKSLDSVNFLDKDQVGAKGTYGRPMTAIKEKMLNHDLFDWYREWDEDGRAITRLADHDRKTRVEKHGKTLDKDTGKSLSTGRRLDSIWGPAGLVDLIENVVFTPTSSDHYLVEYKMVTTNKDVDFSKVDLGTGAPIWRLHPGVLADPQFQHSLIDWLVSYEQTIRYQPADPEIRWRRFHKRLKHVVYYLGLPAGKRHKQLADRAKSLSEKMRDDDDPYDRTQVDQQVEHIRDLLYARRALAESAAMGWGGIRRSAYSAFSLVGVAVDKARSHAAAIINCLLDDDGTENGTEVRQRFEISKVVERFYKKLFSAADVGATTYPDVTAAAQAPAQVTVTATAAGPASAPASAHSATAAAAPAPLASPPSGMAPLPSSASSADARDPHAEPTNSSSVPGATPAAPAREHHGGSSHSTSSSAPSASSSGAAASSADAGTHAHDARKLSAAMKEALEKYFTPEELLAALEAEKVGAAAGPDGLPATIYWLARRVCIPLLTDLANSLMDGKSLSKDDATFRAVLKHKKGDKRDLNNYRPVSIPDISRKIIGRVLGMRLSKLENFWSPLQQAYVKEGRKEVSLGLLQMVLTRIRARKEPAALMVILDQEKAFDRVNHDWLLRSLELYNFGPKIRSFVKGLLDEAHIFFSINGWHTEPTKLERGLFQGDPASPMLFLASLHPLLDALEVNDVGLTLGGDGKDGRPQLRLPYIAYSDDLTAFVKDVDQLKTLQRELDAYCAKSGAKFSKTKSRAIVLTPPELPAKEWKKLSKKERRKLKETMKEERERMEKLKAACPWPIDESEELVYLGCDIDMQDGNVAQGGFLKAMAAIRRLTHLFQAKGTSVTTRIHEANTHVKPRVLSRLVLCPVPTDFTVQYMQSVEPFIWLGKRAWMQRDYLLSPESVGGLGMHHPLNELLAATGAAIVRWLLREDDAGDFFRLCLHEYLEDLGLTESSLLSHYGLLYRDNVRSAFKSQSFWGNIAWVLHQLGVTLDEDWSKWTVRDLCAVSHNLPCFGKKPRLVGPEAKPSNDEVFVSMSQCRRLDLFGDILCFCDAAPRGDPSEPQTLPLSPPCWETIRQYQQVMRCSDEKYDAVRHLVTPIYRDWNAWFPTLQPDVQSLLLSAVNEFEAHDALPAHEAAEAVGRTTTEVRMRTRPLKVNLGLIKFNWRLAKVANIKTDEATQGAIKVALARKTPIKPEQGKVSGWPITASDEEWQHLWDHSSPKALPLDAEAREHLELFNLYRSRTTKGFETDHVPPAHEWPQGPPTATGQPLPTSTTGRGSGGGGAAATASKTSHRNRGHGGGRPAVGASRDVEMAYSNEPAARAAGDMAMRDVEMVDASDEPAARAAGNMAMRDVEMADASDEHAEWAAGNTAREGGGHQPEVDEEMMDFQATTSAPPAPAPAPASSAPDAVEQPAVDWAGAVSKSKGKQKQAHATGQTYYLGFCPAPRCNERDSTYHGFLNCHQVQQHVLLPCMSILNAWLCDRPLFFNGRDFLLCWPNLRGVLPRTRMRLALWRALIIDHISCLRVDAIRRSAKEDKRHEIRWTSQGTEVGAVYEKVVSLIITRWEQLRQRRGTDEEQQQFLTTWVKHTKLFYFDGVDVRRGKLRARDLEPK